MINMYEDIDRDAIFFTWPPISPLSTKYILNEWMFHSRLIFWEFGYFSNLYLLFYGQYEDPLFSLLDPIFDPFLQKILNEWMFHNRLMSGWNKISVLCKRRQKNCCKSWTNWQREILGLDAPFLEKMIRNSGQKQPY